MALNFTIGKFTYGLGTEISNAYVRVIPKNFNFLEDMWYFFVKVYINKESRYTERLSEYFCGRYGNAQEAPNPTKPETLSDPDWQTVLTYRGYGGSLASVFAFERGFAKSIIDASDIKDMNELLTEIYTKIKNDFTGSTDDLIDLTMEELVEEYIPGYLSIYQAENP
jgi:hypothetical protein